jgi:autophagy-related protein 5
MANDREILKEVWEGKVPAKFIVDSEDIEADAFFVLLPRVSYLSLTIEKIKKHFQRYIEKEDEIWFSYNSIPLKFHIPIGEIRIINLKDEYKSLCIDDCFRCTL